MGGLPLSKIKLPQIKLLPGKKEQFPIGIDIGSHAIKICQVAKTGDVFNLIGLGSALLPEGAVEDGILQEPEEVARIITTLLNNLKLKEKKVAISISGYSVIVKKINLAVMEERALELAFEGERWYDLVRIAKRRNDPDYLIDKVVANAPESEKEALRARLELQWIENQWKLPYSKTATVYNPKLNQ